MHISSSIPFQFSQEIKQHQEEHLSNTARDQLNGASSSTELSVSNPLGQNGYCNSYIANCILLFVVVGFAWLVQIVVQSAS